MSSITIRLLGGFSIQHHDLPVKGFDSPRLQSLLAYLLLHRPFPIPRQQMAFQLWPDSSEEQAFANLRNALFRLRRLLPEAELFLSIQAQSVAWRADGPYTLDVQQFEEAAQQGASRSSLETAVSLYHGELLPGCFDDWLLNERARLLTRYLHALDQLIDLCDQEQDAASAVRYAERFTQADPYNESGYRRLMTLYAGMNDPGSAIKIYQRCAAMLRQELGVDPGQETQQLHQRILAGPGGVVPAINAAPYPLLGRKAEWSLLQKSWESVRQGSTHMVLICGEAGVGKSRLAEEMVRWVARQGYITSTGHCYAPESSLAYAPISAWLGGVPLDALDERWLVEIARVTPDLLIQRKHLPSPGPLTENWQRRFFFEALAHALRGSTHPRLLVIEDIQWADPDSLEWIHFCLTCSHLAPVLILATLRQSTLDVPEGIRSLLSALKRNDLLRQIILQPLDLPSTAALGRVTLQRPLSAAEAHALYQASEGNPLFIIEMTHGKTDLSDLVLPLEAVPGSLPESHLPEKVQLVIEDHLHQLSAEARGLVEQAAVIGRSLPFAMLQQAAGLSEVDLVACIDEIWRKGIWREKGHNTYDFSHDKIRETVLLSLSQTRRAWLHKKAAQAIESAYPGQLGDFSRQLAYHQEQAGNFEAAAQYYRKEAERSLKLFANQDAVKVLQKGMSLLKTLPETPARSRLELAYQLTLGAAHLAIQIRAPEVREDYTRAYQIALQVGTVEEQFVALKGIWEHDNYWVNLDRAMENGKEMLRLSRQSAQPQYQMYAHYALGSTYFFGGQLDEARHHFEQGIAYYDSLNPPAIAREGIFLHGADPGVSCRTRLAWALCLLGYPKTAFAVSNQAIALARERNHPYSLCLALTLSTLLYLSIQEYPKALALADESIALAGQYGYQFWLSSTERMRNWAIAHPQDSAQWERTLARENQEWQTVHLKKAPVWFTISQSYYINGLRRSGRTAEGLERVDAVLRKLNQSPERMWEPELYRLKGMLLEQREPNDEAVDRCYLQALRLAQQQHARMLEVRILVNLLQREKQMRGDAVESYQWLHPLRQALENFPEKENIPDLQQAARLLAETRVSTLH